MRNLKRALSLTLASVMLLGMMVVGAGAASFPDVDENDNVEAIEVLAAVGVIVGENGSYYPDRAVTRNEMAVIMTNLMGLNANDFAGTCPFTDVASWAQNYVAACYANGIIAGRSETIFDGQATVTAVEAAAMMMRALGYFQNAGDYEGGFTNATVRQAAQIRLFAGVSGNATSPMNRNDVAQLALNTLEADVVEFTGTMGWEFNGITQGYQSKYSPKTDLNNHNNGYNYTNDSTTTHQKEYLQLLEDLYDGKLTKNTSDADDFNRPVTTWNYDGKAIISTNNDTTAIYTTTFTPKDLYNALGSTVAKDLNGTKLDVFVNGGASSDNIRKSDSSNFDGTTLYANRTDADTKLGGKGVLTEVYVDSDNNVTIVMIDTYLVKATADYSEKNEELAVSPQTGLTLASSKISNDDVAVSGYKKDDLLLVTGVVDGTGKLTIKTAVPATVVENVTVSEYKGTKDYVTAGGTKYSYSANAGYDPDTAIDSYNLQKTGYNLVLDNYGFVIGVEKYSSEVTLDDILFVKEEGQSGVSWQAKVVFMDGREEIVTIAGTKMVGGSDFTKVSGSEGSPGDALTADGKISALRFYEFNVKSNGEYELQDIAAVRQGKAAATEDSTKKNIVGGDVQPIYDGTTPTLVSKTATNDTIFIADGTLYTGVKNSPSVSDADVYYLLDNDNQSYILAAWTDGKGVSTVSTSEYVYIFTNNGSGKDDDGNNYYTYTAIKDGEKVTDFKAATNGKTNGLYKIETYENGYPVLGDAISGSEADVLTFSGNVANSSISYKSGTVSDGTNGFVMAENAQVYVVDVADKDVDVINPSSVSNLDAGMYDVCAIQVSTSDKNIEVLWLVRTGDVPQAVKAVYESAQQTYSAPSGATNKVTIGGVEIDVDNTSDIDAIKTALEGNAGFNAAWTIAKTNEDKDLTFTAKNEGEIGGDGPSAALAAGLTEVKPGVDGVQATYVITIDTGNGGNATSVTIGSHASQDVTGSNASGTDGSNHYSWATDSDNGVYTVTVTLDADQTLDENGEATSDGITFTGGTTAVAAVYKLEDVAGEITTAITDSRSLTIGGHTAKVTGVDLATQLAQFVTDYNSKADDKDDWVASVGADDDTIVFTAKVAGTLTATGATAPTGTTEVIAGADGVGA